MELFHSNSIIQRECRQVMENAARFLTHTKTSGLGSGYKASCEIPANTRIAVYTGTIKRADTRLGDHDIALGEHFASVPLVIDGAPPLKAEDAPPPGLMQLVNHACLVQEWSIPMSLPRANCLVDDAADLTCVLSGLPLIVLRTARVIRAGRSFSFPTSSECRRRHSGGKNRVCRLPHADGHGCGASARRQPLVQIS